MRHQFKELCLWANVLQQYLRMPAVCRVVLCWLNILWLVEFCLTSTCHAAFDISVVFFFFSFAFPPVHYVFGFYMKKKVTGAQRLWEGDRGEESPAWAAFKVLLKIPHRSCRLDRHRHCVLHCVIILKQPEYKHAQRYSNQWGVRYSYKHSL